jgi:hypothetical protein
MSDEDFEMMRRTLEQVGRITFGVQQMIPPILVVPSMQPSLRERLTRLFALIEEMGQVIRESLELSTSLRRDVTITHGTIQEQLSDMRESIARLETLVLAQAEQIRQLSEGRYGSDD